MRAVRAMGRELMNASPAELCIGNIVIRVLYFIREEYSQRLRAVEESGGTLPAPVGRRSCRSGSEADLGRRDRGMSVASSAGSERGDDLVGAGVDIEPEAPAAAQITRMLSDASLSGR